MRFLSIGILRKRVLWVQYAYVYNWGEKSVSGTLPMLMNIYPVNQARNAHSCSIPGAPVQSLRKPSRGYLLSVPSLCALFPVLTHFRISASFHYAHPYVKMPWSLT